jgi:hypothetical protein
VAKAEDSDITNLVHAYHKYFDRIHNEDQQVDPAILQENMEVNHCGGQFGMELKQKMSVYAFVKILGYRKGQLAAFNKYHDHSGLTPGTMSLLFLGWSIPLYCPTIYTGINLLVCTQSCEVSLVSSKWRRQRRNHVFLLVF